MYSTLDFAVRGGSAALIRRVLELKGNPNAASRPLVLACKLGRVDLVRALLDAKANINGSRRTWTPLLAACAHGDLALVKLLVDADADPQLRGNVGFSGHDIALQSAHMDVAAFMANLCKQHAPIPPPIVNGQYTCDLIVDAAERGDAAEVAALLDAKAYVNQTTVTLVTALFQAAKKGHIECVKLLLDRKADPSRPHGKYDEETAEFVAKTDEIKQLLNDATRKQSEERKVSSKPAVTVSNSSVRLCLRNCDC